MVVMTLSGLISASSLIFAAVRFAATAGDIVCGEYYFVLHRDKRACSDMPMNLLIGTAAVILRVDATAAMPTVN
jgi:hypothetical protein